MTTAELEEIFNAAIPTQSERDQIEAWDNIMHRLPVNLNLPCLWCFGMYWTFYVD